MKIFVAGIATESNTFSPIPTALSDFLVQRGRDVAIGRIEHPSLDLSNPWGTMARARGDEFVFGLMAWAQPGGPTTRSAYECLRDELLSNLREVCPVGVVLLNLHGAMVAQGYEDCEQDLIERVRDIVGSKAIIGVELDLHCHLSERKIKAANIVITYKEYPHVDTHCRAKELFELAAQAAVGQITPVMALFDCQMVGLYPTTREPMRTIVAEMLAAEQRKGVLSVSFAHGFQFADLPQMGAKVLVVADSDLALAGRVAAEFGRRLYYERKCIGVESFALTMEEALGRAIASTKTPVVVADQSDNTGGGAPGDATFALEWLLKREATAVALAILYDPEAVRVAKKAGTGARLDIRLGGKLGRMSGHPLDIMVSVIGILENYQHLFPQQSGEPWAFPAGDVVLLRCGGVDIVVSSERCQCVNPAIFSDLGIDPRAKRILVVKSVQHFYAAFAPIAGEILYMAGPGAVSPDPRQITYGKVQTGRLYPWVDDPLGPLGREV